MLESQVVVRVGLGAVVASVLVGLAGVRGALMATGLLLAVRATIPQRRLFDLLRRPSPNEGAHAVPQKGLEVASAPAGRGHPRRRGLAE
jgi:hypothetical protein